MSRYTITRTINQPQQFVDFMMQDFATKNGFKPIVRKNEDVLRSGDGFFNMYRYLKYSYSEGTIAIEAWCGQFSENDMTGFVGALPKKAYKESLIELCNLLTQYVPPVGEENTNSASVQVQVADHSGSLIPAFLCSLFGIFASFLIPILGMLLSIFGLYFSNKARNSNDYKMANFAMVLGVIGFLCALGNWLYTFLYLTMR